MKIIGIIFWVLTILGGLAAILAFVFGMLGAENDMQMASVSASAMGFVVIPYCISRAISELKGTNKVNEQ